MIVRPYDYIIGRLNGKFLQSDPSLYRHNKKSKKNILDHSYYYHDGGDSNTSEFKTTNDSAGSELPSGNIQQPIEYDTIERPLYLQPDASTISQPLHKPVVDVKSSDSSLKFSERKLKPAKFKTLLNRHCPLEIGSKILRATNCLVYIANDDDFLDKYLTLFREIDRANSGFS